MTRRATRDKAGGSGREEILAVARRLFMTRGYRAVSTRDIADAVGLTQPALYHHFGGKEALYIAVLEDELARQSVAMSRAAALDAPATARLAAVASGIAERAEYDMAQMFHDLRFEISEANRLRIGLAFRDAMMRPLMSVVDALVDEGAIAPPEHTGLGAPEVVMYILSVIRMLTETGAGPARGPQRSPEEIGALTVRLVTGGIGPHSAT